MKVVLIGAYGYTARLISELLQKNGVPFSVAGKNLAKLILLKEQFDQILDTEQTDLNDISTVDKLISKYDIFINCAGPFTEESFDFVKSISQSANKIYLDITGESEFVKTSFENFHSEAKKNNTLIIHSCSFESALAELGVALIKSDEPLLSCKSFYMLGYAKASPGTRMTMKLSKFRKFNRLKDGAWIPIDSNAEKFGVSFNNRSWMTIPYPLPEIVLFNAQFNAQSTMSYLLLKPEEALFSQNSDTVTIDGDTKVLLEKFKQANYQGPETREREGQKFELVVEIQTTKTKKAIVLKGSDMYGLTAKIIVMAVQKILNRLPVNFGVLTPGSLFIGSETDTLKSLQVQISYCSPLTPNGNESEL